MIGDRIKDRRIELDLTQKDVADKLNITYQTISKYERGINSPDAITIAKLADILDCSADYLVGKTDDPDAKIIESKNCKIELDKEYPKNLTPEEAEKFLAYLEKSGFNVDMILEKLRNGQI